MKKVSMQEIADALEISKNSVSQALRDLPGVSEETKAAVRAKAKELGYHYKKGNGKSEERSLLLMATDFAFSQLSFFGEIVKSIEAESRKQNFKMKTFVLTAAILQNQELPKNIHHYDGIILLSHSDNTYIQKVIAQRVPVVLVDHHDPSLLADAVLSKNTDGTFQAVDLLIKNGCKKIGFIGDIDFSPSYLERFRGYHRALNEAKVPYDKAIEITQIQETQGALFTKLKEVKQMPDAWFCVNSGLAFMLNSYLQTAGYTIPDDISIICFDDTEFTRMANPQITNVATNLQYMGQLSVKMLQERLAHPNVPFTHAQIVPQLTLRESVKLKG